LQFDFPGYSLIYMAGGVLTLVLAILIWKRQFAPGVVAFTLFLVAMTVWTFSSALEAGAVEIPAKIIFAKIEYLALVSTGALTLTFVLEYTRVSWAKRRHNLLLLWIIPVLTLAMTWTNEWHGLLWPRIYLINEIGSVVSVWEHGPVFWVNLAYQYLLYTCGIILILRFGWQKRGMHRRHIDWLLVGSLIPVVGSIVYVAGGSPIRGFDTTPVSICLMGVVYAVTIIRFKFMEILPVATNAFLKTLPDGFLLLDADGLIVSLNPATGRIIGQETAALKDRKLASIWPELDKVAFTDQSEQNIELTREQPGRKIYLNTSIESFTDGHGTLTGKLVILRDITELKLTQRQLESEINKRSQFTRAIVHELRNPLTAIISSSSLLEEPKASSDTIRMALARNISRASIDLEKRVNELFELARGELGLLEIKLEIVDMNSLIRDVVAEMSPVAAGKGITLEYQACEVNACVWGDKDRLRQVFFNLLGNSLKFTDRGLITIRTQHYKGGLLLSQVEDTGKGIEKEELDNLFDPYQRSQKQKTSSSGLGIGLALCKQYIELHKGSIWAESIPGKGTTINFVIPLKTAG
jgi:PAS domain S-box-containing protein